jgi:hypothetical protein
MRGCVRRANIRYRTGIGHRNMLQVLAHSAIGTTLAHFLSRWATPAILLLYLLTSLKELRYEQTELERLPKQH